MNDYSSISSLPTFSPSGLTQAVTGGIFYIAMIIALFYGVSSIYAVIRYGESKTITFIASILYTIIFLTLFGSGVQTLGLIK